MHFKNLAKPRHLAGRCLYAILEFLRLESKLLCNLVKPSPPIRSFTLATHAHNIVILKLKLPHTTADSHTAGRW